MFDGPSTSWQATLALRFCRVGEQTVFTSRHRGPLRVQKPLYPEGPEVCHVVLIHPPGGIAGGDALTIEAAVEAQAHALVTTPGAAKWYKANGRRASQRVALTVAGALEWLPQEAIVFDHAEVHSEIALDVAGDARVIGWDIVALGRRAAGEHFDNGCFAQSIRLCDEGALQWIERTRIAGGDALLDSPIGLAGFPVFGCLWAVGPRWTDAAIESLRAALPAATPITRVAPRLLVARTLGTGTQAVRRALEALWRELRPLTLGREATAPRIWAT
jgi:urease accessory protein